MMLGIAQKKALELLQAYGCLRENQIEKMLIPQVDYLDMDAIKRQLNYFGLVEFDNGYIRIQDRGPDRALIDAVDIMQNFPMQDIEMHKPAAEPFVLTFFKNNKDGKLCRYDVCRCEPGTELILSALLEGLEEKHRTVLIQLADIRQRGKLHIIPEHFFVVREDGSYKFYKPASLPEREEKKSNVVQ